MKQIEGDLIQLAKTGRFDVIVHGCNCFHTMGAGFAKAICEAFPEALGADKATPIGDKTKLGSISTATVGDLVIVNAYTQFDYRGRGLKADYEAIREAFRCIARTFPNKRIGYPLIGAGLAGGDWSVISEIIEDELKECDHTLVVLPT